MPKLVPNLFNKLNYICHYRNLKFYLEHGLILRRVHKVIRFRQSAWLLPYIAINTEWRSKSTSAFHKDQYKLNVNACFGKTCEDTLKHQDNRLLNDEEKITRLIQKPHCITFRMFTEDVAAIAMQKLTAKVNKPTYAGFAVLEFAKLLMYRFHYDHVQRCWPDGRARLVLTDTDSPLYEIATEDVYEDIFQDQDLRSW